MTYTIGTWSYPYSVQQTPDDGYIITGCTMQTTSGIQQIFLLKTNSTGSQEWLKTYGNQWAYGYSVRITRDGGYIVAGACNGVYILKTNSTGGIHWSRNYDAISYANSIVETEGASERYLVSETGNGYAVRLLMLDSLGNVLWSSSLGNEHLPFYSQDSADNGLQATPDGGYVIVGGTVLDDKGVSVGPNGNLVLIKTDSRGEEDWNMTYGGNFYERGTSIQVTPDGGYVIMGFDLPTSEAVFLFETDSSGKMLWNRTYINNGFGGSVSVVPDGGYVVVGGNTT
jgi:hypothetical protein